MGYARAILLARWQFEMLILGGVFAMDTLFVYHDDARGEIFVFFTDCH
jgi:hypothetical protein